MLDVYVDNVMVGSLFCGFQFDGVLYNNGNVASDYFSTDLTRISYNVSSSSSINNDNIQLSCSNAYSNGYYGFSRPISNLTKYSKLRISYSCTMTPGIYNVFNVGLSSNLSVNYSISNSITDTGSSDNTIEVNLSSLENGVDYYLIVGLAMTNYTGTSGHVNNVYIKKIELIV